MASGTERLNPNSLRKADLARLLNATRVAAQRRESGAWAEMNERAVGKWKSAGCPENAGGTWSIIECLAWFVAEAAGGTAARGMTRAEIAGICGVSRATVGNWITDGLECDGKAIRLGEVAAYLARKVQALAQARREPEGLDEEYARLMGEQEGDELIDDSNDPMLKQGRSYYQELGRKRLAEKLRLELEEKRGRLQDVEELSAQWARIGGVLRSRLEAVGRRFGSDISNAIADAIAESAREIGIEFPAMEKAE